MTSPTGSDESAGSAEGAPQDDYTEVLSPQQAWPFPIGEDLSDGATPRGGLSRQANEILGEMRTRKKFRYAAVAAALGTVAALICALFIVIGTFMHLLEDLRPQDPPSVVATHIPPGGPASGGAPSAPSVVKVKHHLSVDLGTLAPSLVAIVSALVLAMTVLTIALVKSTFGLLAEDRRRQEEEGAADDGAVVLPGVEAVKALSEALATAVKSLPGNKSG